jgi:hypothetical protein
LFLITRIIASEGDKEWKIKGRKPGNPNTHTVYPGYPEEESS